MDMKKEILLVTCALISIFGLVLIYFSTLVISPSETKISKIDANMKGKLVSVTGKISYVRVHPSGHIFLTLSDGDSKIEVPIFSNLANKLSSDGIAKQEFRKGRVVRVIGVVDEYKGLLQVIPRKSTDIQILEGLK